MVDTNPTDPTAYTTQPLHAPAAPLSADEIAEMRRLHSASSQGDWQADRKAGSVICRTGPLDGTLVATMEAHRYAEDAAFIASAHAGVPRLLSALEALTAENARLAAIIGPKAHCKSCGSVVDMAGEYAMLCDCTENYMPERQRLGPFDPEVYDAFAKLRAEFTELRAQYLADFGQAAQPETYVSDEAEGLRPLTPDDIASHSYLLTRAAKLDGGIDMTLLGKLCRELPDEATKREVAEMMDTIRWSEVGK